MEEIKVEAGIPLPHKGTGQSGGRHSAFDYRGMRVGDSFFSSTRTSHNLWVWQKASGYEFARRKVTENGIHGFRTWRTK